MPDYKPFSIYDDDEEKKKPPQVPEIPKGEQDLNLEIEDVPSNEDAKTRLELMRQLGEAPPAGSASHPTPVKPSPESLESAPFLHGESAESVEDRAKALIRRRQDTGKIRDRRKVASIFDKPIEPDKAIRPGKSIWNPLSYRAQAFWFLFPALALFAIFNLYPIVQGFQVSLTHYSPLGKSFPVGWDNYNRALQDPLFWQTVVNATAFTLLSLALGFWPPILLAIFLNEIGRGKGIFKVIYLLPFIIPAIPAANLWKWIFDEGFGVLNSILTLIAPSVGPVGWLTDPRWALISIVLMFVWKNSGWFMLIYFASLQNLPEELYEAAELDGAGVRKKIFNITLPHLVPIMWFLSIIQVITAFQIFTEVFVMTNGGPMHSTEVIGTYIYKTAFGSMDLGYASAMAMLMFGFLLAFTMARFFQLKQVSR
ncbi:MAG TPA: sugar ABC transporter permease [bacterium]|nr:sugar ABC transporter permease [bacterium]